VGGGGSLESEGGGVEGECGSFGGEDDGHEEEGGGLLGESGFEGEGDGTVTLFREYRQSHRFFPLLSAAPFP